MSTIKYRDEKGVVKTFYYGWDMLPDFCAMDQCYGFADQAPYWYDNWDDEERKPVAQSRILRELLKENATTPGTNIFMGDKKGGPADTLLFPYVPKRPFTVGKIRFKPKLSAYKCNPNSGNDCRYLILETEAVKPKKPKKEKAA